MDNFSLVISMIDKTGAKIPVHIDKCVSFVYEKERYTPYTSLSCTCIVDTDMREAVSAKLYSGSKVLHYGTVDTAEISYTHGSRILRLTSRGFTLALGLNQPKPQINSRVTLDSLLSRNVTLPNVECQSDTAYLGYIYVFEGTSLWDAVVAYSIKAYGTYPYIRGANSVFCTAPDDAKSISVGSVIKSCAGTNLSSVISDVHMADENGNYETYNLSSDYANFRDITRHKQIKFDKQWANTPNTALLNRINFSMRARTYDGVTYKGYNGEDLMDSFSADDGIIELSGSKIHRMIINGSSSGVFTTLYTYYDEYAD